MTNPIKEHKKYQRIFSLLISLFFVTNQILPSSYAFAPEKNYIPSENPNTPTKTLDETTPSVDSDSVQQAATSQDFLEQELVLEKVTTDSEDNNEEYQLEEQTADYALANFSKDYAAAEIVKGGLTAEDVRNLAYHPEGIEIGGDIVEGKIVLYTIGSEAEIAMTPAAKALHAKSTLSWHSHPAGANIGVSLADMAEVPEGEVRYAITSEGVNVYDQTGILDTLTYQQFADKINAQYKSDAPTKETRDLLHQYIEEITAYNEDPTKADLLVSSGETIYPNLPRLGTFDSQSPLANFAATQLTDASETDKRIRIIRGTYNAANGSYGGAIMNFGSTPANLSAASSFVFSFRTDNTTSASCSGGSNCIKVEFVDNTTNCGGGNCVASVFVSNLNSSFIQKTISKSILNSSNPSVDYSRIKQINFVMDYGMVANKPNGFFEVKTGGLYFEPTFAAGSGPVTDLAGKNVVAAEVEPTGHNTSVFTQTSKSQFSFDFLLGNGSNSDFSKWGGAVMSFGNTTPYSITAADLVIGVKATGTTKVKFDVVSGTGANAKVTTVVAQGVTTSDQFFRISKTLLDQAAIPGFDASNITAVYIIVDNNLAGSDNASGTVNITTANITSTYGIDPDASNPAITNVPVTSTGARPTMTSFVSYNSAQGDYSDANLLTFSQTFAQLNFNTYNTTSYAGVFFTYDNPATNDNNPATTSDIETIDLNTAFPSGIVLALDNGGTAITEANLEVTDITGKKDTVTLTNILASGQRWKILNSKFDEVDITKIQSIAIVEAGRHVGGRLNIDWGTFSFVPPIPADGSNPAITPVPGIPGDQDKPAFTGFASYDPNNADPTKRDFSNAIVTSISPTFQQIDMNLYNTFSYGGAFVSFDNPKTNDNNPATTSDIETINLITSFPNGIVLGLDNGGTDITSAKLEVTDITGKKDVVLLTGIGTTGKRWKVLTSQFDEVDLSKIQTISLVVEGRHVGSRLNVDWGNFYAAQGSDATNPAIQKLPVTSTGERPVATAFASAVNPIDNSKDYSNATVTLSSQTFATLDSNTYNTNSFSGVFVSYDNGATNDGNPATTTDIETINLNTAFPNGLVFGLDNGGTDVTQVKLEVTDINGNKDFVLLGGIQNFGKRWKVLASQFDDADVTKIQSIALVIEGRHVGAKLNIDWGNFFFVPPIPSDPSNPAITPVPTVPGDLDKPVFTAFASYDPLNADPTKRDFSNATNTSVSPTFQQLDMNLYNTFSYGGGFVSFDDPKTNDNNAATVTDIETIDLSVAFPSGIVLGLDNGGTDITVVKLEVTDRTGKKDSVYLSGIAATGKRWKVLNSQFDEVDTTKIQTISLVVEGRHVGSRLNVDWGNFYSAQASDATNPAIQKLPVTSTGERPAATAFASAVNPIDNSKDYSNATVTLSSQTFATVDMNLYNTNSFGGMFVSYDNGNTNDNNPATTTDIETINLNTAFPNGLVFSLDNGGTDITQVSLEITDINGNKDSVLLGGIQNFGKRWKVLTSQFDDADVTKVQSIALVVSGRHVGGKLNIDWGNFFFVPPIPSDPSNPAITPVPTVPGDLDKPAFTGFASYDPLNADPTKRDFSNVTNTSVSPTFQQLDMNLYNTFSYGGGFVSFDNPATNDNNPATVTDIETIDLSTVFPNGIVLGLDNGGTDITQVKLEVTDRTGKKDSVILGGILATGKRWKVLASQFDEIDITKVQTLALVVEGRHVGSRLNVDWGTFASPQASDATNPAVQKLPVTSTGARPVATAFASAVNPIDNSKDYSNATIALSSQTFATVDMNLYNTNSFGGMFVDYDDPATNDNNAATTTDIERINLNTAFPNGLVFRLDNGGTDITKVKLEVTGVDGKKDFVELGGIQNFGKTWKVLASQFDDVDVTNIKSIALVVEGRHVGGKLNIDWGNFFFVPPIPSDPSNPAITPVPTVPGDLDKPAFTAFASYDPLNADPTKRDFSNAANTSVSPTFQQLDMNLYNTFSYGGGFVSFDNPKTNDNNPATVTDIETIDLSTVFPNGIVLGLDNGGTDITQVKLEVTDRTGKKDSVILSGILATGKRWKVLASQFDEIDITKVQTIALVVEGRHVGSRLNVDWGTFLSAQASDATNPAIQKLPVTSTGERPAVTAFASQVNPIDNSTDYSNATAAVTSQTFATINMNLYNTNSFGGMFVSYDNGNTNDNNPATTTDIETINLNTAFPNGLVFSLDNGGTDITQVSLEITDINGNKDSVLLGGIQNFGKRWKVLTSQFDDADVTKVQSIALVVSGRHVGGKLNIDWGNFYFVPPIPADGTNPAITFVPLTSTGSRVVPTSFSSNNPANSDFSNSTTTALSATFAQIDVNLYNTNSYGGTFLNYDNAATNDNNPATTTDIETINLSTVFPNGIVLGLDNGGTGLNKVKLEVTDINGKKDAVFLTGILATGQRYKVLAAQFDEVDITKIQTISLVIEGRQVGKRINVDWGLFDYVPVVNADVTNPAITKVPVNSKGEKPALTAFASQINPVDGSTDYSNASVALASPSQGTLTTNLYNTNSYGGFTFGYDDPATTDNNPATTTDIESINMNALYPNGLVLALASNDAALTQVKLELTDVNGNKDIVILNGLTSSLKRFKISMGMFDQIDVTKVKQISIVVEGRHVGSQLSFDWGDFFYIPSV